MQKNKVLTYIGFAKRAGKFKTGTNAIKTVKSEVYLLIICKTASENAQKEAVKLAERFGCPLYESVNFTVEEIADKENCKLMAILDFELSKAIIANMGNDFKEFSGGIRD